MTTNPALSPLQFLAGAWDMELSGAAFLPDPDASVHGPVTFEWIEQGAALVMRMDGGETPAATWIIGRDESESDSCVLYTDDRGVSRVYRMSFSDRTWRMWHDTTEFAQRFDAEVLARTGRLQHVAWAVGAWIGAAYWFTASTSFANPAVTIGRSLTSTYAGIAPASVPGFIAAQLVGGAIGTVLAVAVYPVRRGRVQVEEPAQLAG